MKKHLAPLTPQAWVAIALAAIIALSYVVGIIIPPPGELTESQLSGMRQMIILVTIFFAWDAVIRGLNAKFEHGDTKVTISQQSKPNEHENN